MKLLGRNENLPCTCGNLPNITLAYGNNIYSTLRKYIRKTEPPVLIPILFNKNLNVINGDIINVNDICTHHQSYDSNG